MQLQPSLLLCDSQGLPSADPYPNTTYSFCQKAPVPPTSTHGSKQSNIPEPYTVLLVLSFPGVSSFLVLPFHTSITLRMIQAFVLLFAVG